MSLKNYYSILNVSSTASAEAIKAAYRELAKKYHPDKNMGNKSAEEYFKEIQQAYAILSNPEKRKKYDLKFLYNTFNQNPSGQYSGNAYQYAQQQARQKYQYSNKTQATEKSSTESYHILISIGIALVLLYFIISYSTENKSTAPVPSSVKQDKISNPEILPEINNFDSPYTCFFGEEISDSENKNSITIHNSDQTEAVVCLVENQKPNKSIRNQYMNAGSTFKMNNIPDGDYFLKVYYGNQWDTAKTYLDKKIKGGFISEIAFVKLNTEKDILKMKQEKAGPTISFSSYEIELNPYQKTNVQTISSDDFFK
ncbi:MAG: J domain-containing protein [Bacteroidetes bacterium]|nr:J domain-containing protein [Bacteroidota bacterium]